MSDYNRIRSRWHTSLNIAGLSKGVTYYYRVRSVNGGSLSGYAEGNVTTLLLGSPEVLESSDIDSISFTARWREVEDAEDYELQLLVEDTIFLSQSREFKIQDTSIRLENLSSNTVYYHRVRSRNDNLGTSFYSRWVKTTTTGRKGVVINSIVNTNNVFRVYPNPASNIVYVSSSLIGIISYSLIDMQGRLMKRGECDWHNCSIDINDMESGVYYLELEMVDGSKSIHTIVKN